MGEFQGVSETVRGEWGASLFFVVMYEHVYVYVYVVYGRWLGNFFILILTLVFVSFYSQKRVDG